MTPIAFVGGTMHGRCEEVPPDVITRGTLRVPVAASQPVTPPAGVAPVATMSYQYEYYEAQHYTLDGAAPFAVFVLKGMPESVVLDWIADDLPPGTPIARREEG